MGRYRPPAPPKSPYITADGAKALEAELIRLWKQERPMVAAAVQAAAKNGDRSENGDYIYGKQRLREIDRRVRYLNKRLAEITVVDKLPDKRDVIYFGAWVTLEDNKGVVSIFQLVGSDEAEAGLGKISIDAPLARQLLGKRVGQVVSAGFQETSRQYEILSIDYKL